MGENGANEGRNMQEEMLNSECNVSVYENVSKDANVIVTDANVNGCVNENLEPNADMREMNVNIEKDNENEHMTVNM